ncbi:MAG: peptidase [Rhizobiales bacterium PAR1]|nr:MAG: peptidase [Rhizobiales bacterium PAR1]
MTYCVGILTGEGLVMIADTRTNAGLDNVATFRKLHIFRDPGKKLFSLATAGNLGFTQSVISILREGLQREDGHFETLLDQPSMFRAAQFVGEVIRYVYKTDGPALEQHGASVEVSMLLAGQIEGRSLRLFMLYKAGNFIEATADTPYLQIGEHKYGKPILDRAVTFKSDLYDALKLGLISMDSTMRSNLGVGLPIDILVMRRDAIVPEVEHRIEAGEPYFHDLRERWSAALRRAHIDIPTPPYKPKPTN